jgi:hypothetical protein
MRATSGPEAVTETEKVFLVDALKQRADGVLDDLVLNGRDGQRELHTTAAPSWDRRRLHILIIRASASSFRFSRRAV